MVSKKELIKEKYESLLEEMKTMECMRERTDLFPEKDAYSPELIYNFFLYKFENISIHRYIKDLLDSEKIEYTSEELRKIYISFFNFVKFLKELA